MERPSKRPEDRNKGSITVFLAITFLFIIALLGTLIDGARVAGAHSQVYHAADLASTSALSKFDKNLKNRYGLFAYPKNRPLPYEKVAKQNLSASDSADYSSSEELYNWLTGQIFDDPAKAKGFDLYSFKNIAATQIGEPLTLANPHEFERQIFEYVKFRGPMELFKNDIDMAVDGISEELEMLQNEETAEAEMAKLETKLAELQEAKQNYNKNKLKPFKNHIKKIEDDQFKKLSDKIIELNNLGTIEKSEVTQAVAKLTGSSSLLEAYDLAMTNKDKLEAVKSELQRLEGMSTSLIAEVEQFATGFTGDGTTAAYNGTVISGAMYTTYQEDMEEMKKIAELVFDGTGNTLASQNTLLTEIESEWDAMLTELTEIDQILSDFLVDAEDGYDHDKDKYTIGNSEIEPMVTMLHNFIVSGDYKRHRKIFDKSRQLTTLDLQGGEENQEEIEKQEALEEDAKKDEAEDKRKYELVIPSGYPLPGGQYAADDEGPKGVTQTGGTGNWGSSIESANANRNKNKSPVGDQFGVLSDIGDFTLSTLDNAMLGSYAIGNFQNTLCWNVDNNIEEGKELSANYLINMRNQEKAGFFKDCEVEYLIKGNMEETKNYSQIRTELRALFFVLNYAQARRVPQIKSMAETIAKAVQAALTAVNAGVAKIAYYGAREAVYVTVGTIQTTKDLENLYLGKQAALIKKTLANYDGIAGSFGLDSGDDDDKGSILINYISYLYLRMVVTDHDVLVGRLQNLVTLNMNSTSAGALGQDFSLENCATSSTVKVEATVPFWFINIIITADNTDAVGITINKAVSQKY